MLASMKVLLLPLLGKSDSFAFGKIPWMNMTGRNSSVCGDNPLVGSPNLLLFTDDVDKTNTRVSVTRNEDDAPSCIVWCWCISLFHKQVRGRQCFATWESCQCDVNVKSYEVWNENNCKLCWLSYKGKLGGRRKSQILAISLCREIWLFLLMQTKHKLVFHNSSFPNIECANFLFWESTHSYWFLSTAVICCMVI